MKFNIVKFIVLSLFYIVGVVYFWEQGTNLDLFLASIFFCAILVEGYLFYLSGVLYGLSTSDELYKSLIVTYDEMIEIYQEREQIFRDSMDVRDSYILELEKIVGGKK